MNDPSTDRVGDTAVARCVAGSADVFAAEHWGRAPLLSAAASLPRDFTDLFDAHAVDELVSARGLRTPFLRMAKEGSVLPAARFTRGGGAGASVADQAADDKVLTAMADGSTLVLQGLHRTWPPLVEFGAKLADELGHPVQINAYITPPQNQGFSPHYDVHDVFVLQVTGRKKWTVHRPVVEDPLANQPWDARRSLVEARTAEAPVLETVLAPGDAVYLPRGTIHAAQALGELSIHLTVGVHPLTRYDLVQRLLEAVQDDPALRASLPMGVDLADPAVLAPALQDTVGALQRALADVPVSRVADELGTNLMRRTRPVALGPLAQLDLAERLAVDTALRLRAALRYRFADTGERLQIVLLDRTVELPAGTAEAVKIALAGAPFTPANLPGLEPAEQLTLARRLVREGLLVVA
ncbi:cupin domain-containing protein [uncultured Jatrophihabitans sp.]|uniref:cupin domain-containing protein n=1 Tax=uncultured Jatrophihabitans sp. TaxID=1610747 RepID=UPI0035C980BC